MSGRRMTADLRRSFWDKPFQKRGECELLGWRDDERAAGGASACARRDWSRPVGASHDGP